MMLAFDQVVMFKMMTDLVRPSERQQAVTKARPPPGGMKLIQPDRFDGAANSDLIGFLDHFEACSEHNDWNLQEMAVHLRLSLRNKAARAVHAEDGRRLSYPEMVARLKRRFGMSGQEIRCRNELRLRRRRQNESIQDVADAILTLLEQAYSNVDVSVIGVEYFLEALNDEDLVTRIRDHCPQDFESAVSMAMQFESYSRSKSSGENTSKPRYEGKVRAVQMTSEESQVVAASAVEPRKSSNACGNCGKSHPTDKCWAKGGANSDNAPYRIRERRLARQSEEISMPVAAGPRHDDRPRLDSSEYKCHLCECYGHRKHQCSLFPAWIELRRKTSTVSANDSVQTEAKQVASNKVSAIHDDVIVTLVDSSVANNNVAKFTNLEIADVVAEEITESVNSDIVVTLPSFGTNSEASSIEDKSRRSGIISDELMNIMPDLPDLYCNAVESFDSPVYCPGYLRVHYEGRCYSVLLDSGCDISVFPAKMINRQDLQPFTRNTIAANGSAMKVLGQTIIELEVDGVILLARVLVSPNVIEPMLSRQWMRFNNVTWSFARDAVSIRGKTLKLEARTTTPCIRRVVVEEKIVLPPLSQTQVSSRVEFSNFSSKTASEAWATEANVCKNGVCVARSVFSNDCHGLPVLVMNVTDHPITLDANTVLSELVPVECAAVSTETRNEAKLSEAIELIVSKVDVTVTETEREALRKILYKYAEVISLGEFDIGLTNLVEHEIDTGNAKPSRQALRRQPYVYLPQIDAHVEQMLKAGWVVPISSPWSTNIVCVKKADQSIRYCADMRQLNNVTKKDSYPLPNITTCLEALSGAKYYSSIDLASAFHQVRIKESDIEKTTFLTRTGSYAYKRMCFGLSNATATFSRLIDLVMKGLHYNIVILYVDDVLVFAKNVSDMLERIEMVLQRLQAANLKVKPSKCHFLQTEITFLGFRINENGVSTCSTKVEEVVSWPVPTSGHDVKSFLGLCSYYRKFLKGFSDIVAPLNRLTSANVKFEWTKDCQNAFDLLKAKLVSAPILGLPRDGGNYILDTDASGKALGGVLSQVQDGKEVVIAYGGRTLSSSERNYCVTRQELLSVIHFMKKYRCYLLGHHFRLRTDHAALTYLQKTPELRGQQARWLEITQDFDFTTEHRPGAQHGNADALSRKPCQQCGLGELDVTTTLVASLSATSTLASTVTTTAIEAAVDEIGRDQIKCATAADSELREFCTLFADNVEAQVAWGAMLSKSPLQKTLWTQWSRLKFEDGVLYRRWFNADGFHCHWQTVIPTEMQKIVLTLAHKGLRGHFGVHRTQQQLQRRAYWPGWSVDVERFCASCQECSRFVQGKPRRQGRLQSMQVGAPFERLSIDITGPHPRSAKGHIYILTILDHFSKWGEAFPTRNKEAVTVARILVDQFFTKFGGLGMSILTDQGKEFCNALLNEVCKIFKVDKLRTSAYKASTNGAVERWHRTLNAMIAKVVSDNQRDWDEHLPFLLCAYRSARHESTGFTPNFLILGRELIAPLDLICPLPESAVETFDSASDFVDRRKDLLNKAFDLVRRHLKTAVDRNKAYYDMKVKPNAFEIGDFVLYYYPRRYAGRSPKWQKFFVGPYLVLKILGPNSYLIQRSSRAEPIVTHVDKLKAYLGPPVASWIPNAALSAGRPPDDVDIINIRSVFVCIDDDVVLVCDCSMDRGRRQRSRLMDRHPLRNTGAAPLPVACNRNWNTYRPGDAERTFYQRHDSRDNSRYSSGSYPARRHERSNSRSNGDRFKDGGQNSSRNDNSHHRHRSRSRSSSGRRTLASYRESPVSNIGQVKREGQTTSFYSPIRYRAASMESVMGSKASGQAGAARSVVAFKEPRTNVTRSPTLANDSKMVVKKPGVSDQSQSSVLLASSSTETTAYKASRPVVHEDVSSSSDSDTNTSTTSTLRETVESVFNEPPNVTVSEPNVEEKAVLLDAKRACMELDMTPVEQAEFTSAALRLIGGMPLVERMARKLADDIIAKHVAQLQLRLPFKSLLPCKPS